MTNIFDTNDLIKLITFDDKCLTIINEYFNNNINKGFIYCYSNEMFKYYGNDVYKIGKATNIKIRMSSYVTSYIKPCILNIASEECNYNNLAEIIIFHDLRNKRITDNREFFNCDIKIIKTSITNTIEQLNNYYINNKDINTIKELLVNIPLLLLTILHNQINISKLYNIFNNLTKINNIIDNLCNQKNEENFNKILNKCIYKININENNIIFLIIKNIIKYFNIIINNNGKTIFEKINIYILTYNLSNKDYEYLISILEIYNIKNDEGKNEYDYTINLNNISKWLELRKDNLKVLLVSNFIEDQDYIILEKPKGKGRGIGSNNVKPIYLTYTCAKLLCMISRSEKAALIRNYYIDLEKLLIKYKEEIVDSLNQQLGIKENNKKVIEKNKQSGLIYILKVDDETFKIGRTGEIKKRMKQYNVGKLYELPIVFVYKTNDILNIEKCIKDNLKQYQAKNNTELYKIDINFINDTVKYCTKKMLYY